ncbi:low-density lipoprotein receptor class A repeat-containing protein [Endozoicomonas sp. GU-1]|uniref:low-density lipoprotein receptor class A repeat-containing protein n=1 Tax=Endozoicomonas sp. GU-1 TaxID=3009078 RepID=UPI0022B422BD|nr:low-density lipoprotein receptor class A repeat-containing protein [Endozoicomonas sp. GU-1]WBA81961.1 low-density lipoprotein receptor class A repeat-containing protein [Endozoicomonas sp. GU-1]
MKIDSSLPNAFNPQTMVTQTSKKAGIIVCQGYIRCGNDLAQKHEHKPIVDYQVRQLAGVALKAGTILMRRAAGFAFSQVMSSPYVGAVAPGLKESMLFFAALYNQQQMAQAESRSSQLHSPLSATTPPVTTAIDTEFTPSTLITPGQTQTPEAITASVQTPTSSQTTTSAQTTISAQTTTPEAMTASASPPTPDPTTAPRAACADDQFTCDNGECIGKEYQCDGSKRVRYMDCGGWLR